MHHSAINELSILIVLAFIIFISPYFSKLTKIPIAPIEIALGIILGFFGLLPKSDLFEIVAKVGFFYLMFLAGTEIDLRSFFKIDKKVLKLILAYISVLYVIAAFLGIWLEPAFLVFIVIPVMSVGMLSTLFKEYGKNEPWLNIAMITGSIGEVISIALLTLVGAYVEFGNSSELYTSINYLIIFIVLCILGFKGLEVLFWWYPNLKVLLMPHYDKDEKDIRLSMAMFFGTVAVMIYLNLEIVLGAFIAGSFIATFFDHKKDLPHKLGSFGFGFLVPIFFVYIGSTVDLNYIFIPGVLDNALLMLLFMTLIRVVSSFIFIKKLGAYGSILYGLSLSMPLTLLVAVATVAYNANNIEKELYFSFILASLFEAIFAMVLIKVTYYFKIRLK
ncbi:cation:proton antiporter [Campylobacter fetus]|uniref:Sodium:proton antiporter n=1 Tax=Campylobacter fetus subsp. testudinum TaxID=1507806 RepID=A0AAX0H974_CAMFE|nr:cation:proton antiporter [Campylobacter fetus]AGZ81076.2 Na+/H+ exchanger family protein [Campylobacter fetus subsp. testudinum 03-427]AJB44832.1 sodium:proton antiporter [Campylobacter fetus subsp. testudinum]ALV64170.2 Na+/H+ exchanger family protein [Campylobacter fetus subsp. testudinum Sp3]AVK82002.1 cation:proton antiporter [Campylobacter fetus subsp. testudinum]EAI4322812.1 cation:proton antiporter [Campylobacter fetus]